ncbi:adenylate/guanylate cyclase domain-containing protein [Propionivibrio sp.]|uniref:adenylate/guanylate cyclase domain-containing protein n=1 Tax=Propionivibrio sp. TaxID=2212460 RepID=UPI003BF27B46
MKSPANSLRLARGRSGLRRWAALLVVLAAISAGFSWFERVDHLLLDAQFRLLRKLLPRPLENDVLVVGIDEAAFNALREPFALWHPHLGKFLQAMAVAKPSVLGLDIVLPDRSFQFLLPGYDRSLLQGLLAVKAVQVPVVLGQGMDEDGLAHPVFSPYLALTGVKALASAVMCADRDAVIRLAGSIACTGDDVAQGLSGSMAERLGVADGQRGLIDYSVGGELSYVPFLQVLDWFERGELEKLISTFGRRPVLLGVTIPFRDRVRVPVALAVWEPLNQRVPGVLVHAQSLRSMLSQGLIVEAPRPLLVLIGALSALFWFGRSTGLKLLLAAGFVVSCLVLSTWLLSLGNFLPIANIMGCSLFAVAARMALDGWTHAQEKHALKLSFGSYVSPQIMQHILSGEIRPGLGGERHKVCVLFADIRDFTTRSEHLSPEAIVELLNRYFTQMTLAIHGHGGTLDKFIGDGLMAFFGAPQELDHPVQNALAAAREMLLQLHDLNRQLEAEGAAPIQIGIGLHYGEAVIGHVGSASRHEYTAIGDVVNLAARLEGLSRDVGFPIICSAAVAENSAGAAALQEIGVFPIKGRSPERVFAWQGD